MSRTCEKIPRRQAPVRVVTQPGLPSAPLFKPVGLASLKREQTHSLTGHLCPHLHTQCVNGPFLNTHLCRGKKYTVPLEM